MKSYQEFEKTHDLEGLSDEELNRIKHYYQYREAVYNGFESEAALDTFISALADDDNLTVRQYVTLRELAISEFYK